MGTRLGEASRKKRALVVNCYFPAAREAMRLPREMPGALAPVLLAGHLSRERFDVRLYNEVSDGFLERFHPELLAWPDLVIFTGLTCSFDRMLHLTAHLRTENPRVVTVAGGLAVRAVPTHAARFVDYVTTGDVEEIRDIVRDAFGPDHVAEKPAPRYDLASWIGHRIGYAETSRNCNFRCSFCSVTAHGERYQQLSLEHLRCQIEAMGRRRSVLFADNQFHAFDQAFLEQRLALIGELRARGHFDHWAAFVTDAFFWDEENLRRAREAGCILLWVGVESMDDAWLARVNKPQNRRLPQAELMRRCMDAGILFQYALVFDPTERSLAQMERELDIICEDPRVPLPNVVFMAFPMPGTPFFADRAGRGLILPRTRLRDLEGSTLSLSPLDAIEDVADFVAGGKHLRGRRGRALRHQLAHLRRYRNSLSGTQAFISSATMLSIMAPNVTSNPGLWLSRLRARPRTHVSTTDRLDPVYTPGRRIDPRYASYFQPTYITEADGSLNADLAEDLLATRYLQRTREPATVDVPLREVLDRGVRVA